MPVTAGDLGQERQHGIAEISHLRDFLPGFTGDQPVAFGVIRFVLQDRCQKIRQIVGIHLVVTGHDHGDVQIVVTAIDVPGANSAADAPVYFMVDQHNPLVGFRDPGNNFAGIVFAAVVNYNNLIDILRHSRNCFCDQL